MFNLIQLQDRLRGFSEDQLKQFLRTPDPSIPDFMVMAALDEKNDAKIQEAQMKAQNQPSVREEMLAVAGLPATEAGQMASSMAPKTDVRTNTGGDEMMTMARLAEDMPMEDDMEEDEELDIVETPVRRASFGGLMQFGSRMGMAAPLARRIMPRPGLEADRPMVQDLENQLQQSQVARRGYGGGLGGFGRDIMGRVTEQKRGEVDNFLGEVEGMAEDRFDIELDQQQRGMSGKGQVPTPRALPYDDPRLIRAMNEGGHVRGAFFGGLQQFLNPDGTVKKEFEEVVKEAMKDDDDQPDSVRDAQRMMDINKIPEPPKKDDDEKPPPGTDDPAPRDFLSDLTASLDKMREDQKEQMEKNQALGLMLEGIKLSRRGVIDDESGKGLMYGQTQTQKVQDRLAQLQGLEAKIKIAGANIAQKDRAVEAAIKKATAKQGLSAKDALARYTALSTKIIELETDLNRDDLVLDETKKAALEKSLAGLKRVKERLEGEALGLMGDNILDNEFLKELYEVTTPKKEDK
jgi:hypothetical protein|tara:strand:+ start:1289 stop:2845 length:1557 start_codon:yes stop_codon:yes gene_type:complete